MNRGGEPAKIAFGLLKLTVPFRGLLARHHPLTNRTRGNRAACQSKSSALLWKGAVAVSDPVSDWFDPSIAHQVRCSSSRIISLAIPAACNYRAITFLPEDQGGAPSRPKNVWLMLKSNSACHPRVAGPANFGQVLQRRPSHRWPPPWRRPSSGQSNPRVNRLLGDFIEKMFGA